MNVLSVNFQELYERHLCRHSQYGINVAHLLSVVGIYLSLYGIVYGLSHSEWLLAGLIFPYLVILFFNIPFSVFLVNVVSMVLLFFAFFTIPEVPVWVYLITLVISHKIQTLSHKIYSKERDMTEFQKKYKKGFTLFVLLSVYELPILLKYLFFGKRDWCD